MAYSIIDVHMEEETKKPFHNLQQPHVGAVGLLSMRLRSRDSSGEVCRSIIGSLWNARFKTQAWSLAAGEIRPRFNLYLTRPGWDFLPWSALGAYNGGDHRLVAPSHDQHGIGVTSRLGQ